MNTGRPAWRPLVSLLVLVGVVWGGQRLLQGLNHHRQGESMRQLARDGDIRLISSETCRYCVLARQWLTNQRVPFSECLIERDAQCRREYERTGAQGTPTVLVKHQVQLGFAPAQVLEALQR